MSATPIERSPHRQIGNATNIELLSCIAIPILIVVLRLPAFFYSAVGLDETLYFLMAHEVLDGSLPYALTFDNKPPGIYAVFASSMFIFGHGMLAVRIAACLAIAYGCYALYRLILIATNRRAMAITAPYLYVLYTSHLSGLEANTEIFLMPLVATAFCLIWPTFQRSVDGLRWTNYALAGFAFGVAISIKQTAGFDLLAAAICVLAFDTRRFRFLAVLCMFASSLIPVILLTLPYFINNQQHLLMVSTVQANFRRVTIPVSLSKQIAHFGRQLIVFFPVLELQLLGPLFLLVRQGMPSVLRRTVMVASIWFLMDCISAVALGNFASHWVLPLLLPSIVVAVVVLFDTIDAMRVTEMAKARTSLTILILIAGFQAAGPLVLASKVLLHMKGRATNPEYVDRASAIVAYLAQRLHSGDRIFVVSPESAAIYALSGAKVPTRYGFSYFLATPDGIRIAKVDVEKEVDSIFQLQPRFVVLQYPMAGGFETSFQTIAGGSVGNTVQSSDFPIRSTWLKLIQSVREKMKSGYSRPRFVSGMYVYQSLTQ